jgi:hypothetical protein
MTISASDAAADGHRPDRSLELYRDLSVALSEQIAQLKAGTGSNAEGRGAEQALMSYCRALQGALDAEACLVKRSGAWAMGPGGELDLEAARAEILARLAVWVAER